MKSFFRVMLQNDWITDFATLETAQQIVANDEHLTIVQVYKIAKARTLIIRGCNSAASRLAGGESALFVPRDKRT